MVEDEIKDAGKWWIKGLRPPKADASERHVQSWRWFIAVSTGVTALSLTLHILLACGFLTFIHPGFASAADVEQIREERKTDRQTDLEQKILEVREKQCTAPTPQIKSLHTATLQKMLLEYQRLSGTNYPTPSCEDFK